jgi:hypothetical protein
MNEPPQVSVGKRYSCPSCGLQVVVTKGGRGPLRCCETHLELIAAKPLPASD